MVTSDKKLMVCVLCTEKYSEEDVRALRYFSDTSICFKCYLDMQEQKHSIACFGKSDLVLTVKGVSKRVAEGYDPVSPDCNADKGICPDRRYCPLFISGKIHQLQKAVTPVTVAKPTAQPKAPSTSLRPSTKSTGFQIRAGTVNEILYNALKSGKPVTRDTLNKLVKPSMVMPYLKGMIKNGVKIKILDDDQTFKLEA